MIAQDDGRMEWRAPRRSGRTSHAPRGFLIVRFDQGT